MDFRANVVVETLNSSMGMKLEVPFKDNTTTLYIFMKFLLTNFIYFLSIYAFVKIKLFYE